MKRLIICALLVANPVLAEQYLCSAESGATLTINGTEMSSSAGRIERLFYIVSQDDDGKYQAGTVGNRDIWNTCQRPNNDTRLFFCRYENKHADEDFPDYTFRVNTDLTFVAKFIQPLSEGKIAHQIVGGSCVTN